MKITYIVPFFPMLSETFVLGQITDLIDRGHDVEIISINRSREKIVQGGVEKYNLLEKTHFIKKSHSSLGLELNGPLLTSLVFTDMIHAHFAAGPTDWALKISNMFGIPFVFTAHAYDIFINPDVNRLREKFEKATKAITVSNYNKKYLLELLGRDLTGKIEVIRCGIDLDRFKYIERAPKDETRILLVGRFVEKKGIVYAVEAFGETIKECPDAELRIIGDGPLMKDVVNRISALDLKKKVVLLGSRPNSEVSREMKEADIYFHPSVTAGNGDREGVPISIMEAQAVGLPVVSTLHTGIPELVVDGKSGFLVAEKDTRAMAERLKRLIKDPGLRAEMGKEGRKCVEASYARKKEMDELEGLFKGLLRGKTHVSDMRPEEKEIIRERVRGAGTYIDAIQNTLAYKMYRRVATPLRRLLKH